MPTLLILAASPLDQDRLSLGHEVKKVKQSLERSRNRENWRIESNEAATVEDLRRALLDHKPAIVHFCGHGDGDGGLYFEDDQGKSHPTHAEPLARLFHVFNDTVKCVALNACFSTVQAEAIQREIDFVIGMRGPIGDCAATKFAVGFYDAIFAGAEFRVAFELGCAAIDLENLPDDNVPVFLTSPRLGGNELAYTANIQEIEDLIQTYLNTDYHQRFPFTTKGEELIDTMRRHYGDRMLMPVRKVTLLSKRQLDDIHWVAQMRVPAKGMRSNTYLYYLRIRDRSVKIDWEATVGLWSTPVKTFLAFGAKEPIVARVEAEIGNWYYGFFSEKESSWQNVELKTLDHETIYGYVHRSSEIHRKLMEIVEDGNSHRVTLAIGNVDDDTKYVVIHQLLSRSWILPDCDTAPLN